MSAVHWRPERRIDCPRPPAPRDWLRSAATAGLVPTRSGERLARIAAARVRAVLAADAAKPPCEPAPARPRWWRISPTSGQRRGSSAPASSRPAYPNACAAVPTRFAHAADVASSTSATNVIATPDFSAIGQQQGGAVVNFSVSGNSAAMAQGDDKGDASRSCRPARCARKRRAVGAEAEVSHICALCRRSHEPHWLGYDPHVCCMPGQLRVRRRPARWLLRRRQQQLSSVKAEVCATTLNLVPRKT